MPSITSWLRLEPRSREDDIDNGLQARIYDPLWLLGRQWQFNEFKGADAGSPVAARLEADAMQLTRAFMGPLPATGIAAGQPFDATAMPLETAVEREPYALAATVDLRFRVDAGLQFLRMLEAQAAAAYSAAFVGAYRLRPFAPEELRALDAESARLAAAMAGRAMDGGRLYAALRSSLRPASGVPSLPAAPPVAAADQERVLAAARAWLEWYESIVKEPAGESASWSTNRMEYAFAVSAASPQGEVVLEAPDYREGALDWFSFHIRRPATLGSPAAEARQETISASTIPAPVSYPGMPAERWWELEDSEIDFGRIQTLPGDLSSMVMLQFAITYGNDWFAIPVDLNAGSLLRIRAVTVTDSFGEATPVPPFSQTAAADGWKMFTLSSSEASLSGAAPGPALFFLPPALGPGISGPALEEVLLVRDEMANLAWAIEKRVTDLTGKTVDRTYALEDQAAAADGADLSYRLASTVPENWIPLVPVRTGSSGRIRLRRGALVSPDAEAPPLARGKILVPGAALVLEDEEVPRSGARVTRQFQYARWVDGSTHLWIGRRKQAGRGEASSNLQFDFTT